MWVFLIDDWTNNNSYQSIISFLFSSACTTLGAGCYCSAQGADACILLDNAVCDFDTEACQCDSSAFKEEGGVCVDAFNYISDGSSVYPYEDGRQSTTLFNPVYGADASKFGVPSNGYYLEAGGTVSVMPLHRRSVIILHIFCYSPAKW